MDSSIHSTIPILASLDLGETLAFYEQRLGFAEKHRTDDYAIIERDGCELHFWLCRERHIAENTSCYIRTHNVQALFEAFTAKGLYTEPPTLRPWGMREICITDPHGNLLRFGEPGEPEDG